MSNEWDAARDAMKADALLRRADPVPGVEIEWQAAQLAEAITTFGRQRMQLRVAMNPDIDPAGPGGRDAEYRAARQQDYREARAQLLRAAQQVIDQIELEREQENDE